MVLISYLKIFLLWTLIENTVVIVIRLNKLVQKIFESTSLEKVLINLLKIQNRLNRTSI